MRFTQLAMRFVKFLFILLILVIVGLGSFAAYLYYSVPKIEKPISILILGTGGEGHTAPDLTDTMMQVVLNKKTDKISLLSLPRDIWVSEMRAKLNTAYHYGGFKMAGESVKSITGVTVDYTVLIDFSVFKDIVDSIGGIDVDVENSFVDFKYPIAGKENDLCGGDRTYACRYETLTINKGKQKMDGELALKFVRSRNSAGDEGTDIAREKRQQKVVSAIKEKMLSKQVLLNPKAIQNLYDVISSHVKTDISPKSFVAIAKYALETRININYLSIPDKMLKVSKNDVKYDKQYVFIPTNGNWKEVQDWIKSEIY